MANRFTYGYTPTLAKDIKRVGGPWAWFEKQLNPQTVPDHYGDKLIDWWPTQKLDHTTIWENDKNKVQAGYIPVSEYPKWVMMRRIVSKRQVHEIVTEFWENHLHVQVGSEGTFANRIDYGRTVRAHALGRYADLLRAAVLHPAMLIWLDNYASTKRGVNENLGRELLELFTLGVGNYTEEDVLNSSRILTGHRVATYKTFDGYYDPASHWTGPVTVAGFTHPNTAPDGKEVTHAYLDYLARHPATARTVCRKLAIRFVSDHPSEALISHLAEVYLRHDTDIRSVLRALIRHPEFNKSAGAKIRTPTDDAAATFRALGIKIRRPRDAESAAQYMAYLPTLMGTGPYAWNRPDGMPDNAEAWTGVTRVLGSMTLHWNLASGAYTQKGFKYRKTKKWLPRKKGLKLKVLVNKMSVRVLGVKAEKHHIKAVCKITGYKPNEFINKKHPVMLYYVPFILATLLDSPEHMTR